MIPATFTKKPSALCAECDNIITQPICAECLAQHMQVMVSEYNPRLAKKIYGYQLNGETSCLFCHQPMAICAHCFSKDIYEYINTKSKIIAQEFLSRFDFELRKSILK